VGGEREIGKVGKKNCMKIFYQTQCYYGGRFSQYLISIDYNGIIR
jgi:hypothetical protein